MADNEEVTSNDGESNQLVASGAGENNGGNETVEADNQQVEGTGNPAPAGQGVGYWPMIKTLLVRMVIIYMISSFFRRTPPTPNQTSPDGKNMPPAIAAQNLFPKELPMDMYVYINEQQKFDDFDNKDALFWLEEEMKYADWVGGENGDGSYEKSSEIKTPEAVMNNGSIYLHVYFVAAGNSPNPKDKERYNRLKTVHKTKQLNKFKKRKFHTVTNLLTGKTEAHPDLIRLPNDTKVEIISHWHPNLTINLIDDHTPWTRGAVPAPLDEFIEFEPGSNSYYPILYFNDYWNLNVEYQPINDTTKTLNFTLTYSPMSLFKWQMYAAQTMRKNWYSFMGDGFMEESDEDQDSLKQTFLDTNPILLGLTIVVSIVHSVFEFLAFKNDIQFWRNRKSLEGLSVRSVFFNVFQSLIVLLYVLDNETNFVVRVSVFIGLGIEIWKIHKVTDVKIDRENKLFGVIPKISIQDKSTYCESETKKFDRLAFRYLSWALFPLLGGYAVYSLFYLEHRGWYSWVLSLMYGFLLTFGFIMMTPQLFINYKMKSVAHLPWRMLTYKALNTFIDDLFAFVIKMPTLYRIGCFRDDIVFLIYIYQRYIYRIDPTRVNEFGTSAEMLDEHGNPKPVEEVTENGTAIEGPEKSDGTNAVQNPKNATNKKSPKSKKEKKND